MLKAIDWFKVSHAVTFYKTLGYKYVEVPWIVPRSVTQITMPQGKQSLEVDMGNEWSDALIGSGEQGFLGWRAKFKPGDMLVTATPCFRDEWGCKEGVTQPQFFKVELMVVGQDVTRVVLDHAKRLMSTFAANFAIREVVTEEGRDLFIKDFEVGSYGYREYDGFKWTYGTGLAEPRFSTALGL